MTGCSGCSHSLRDRVLRLFTQPQWQGAQVVHTASETGCSGYSHSLNGRVLRLFTQPQRQGAQVIHTASMAGCSSFIGFYFWVPIFLTHFTPKMDGHAALVDFAILWHLHPTTQSLEHTSCPSIYIDCDVKPTIVLRLVCFARQTIMCLCQCMFNHLLNYSVFCLTCKHPSVKGPKY